MLSICISLYVFTFHILNKLIELHGIGYEYYIIANNPNLALVIFIRLVPSVITLWPTGKHVK
jgi:hypothetical protein